MPAPMYTRTDHVKSSARQPASSSDTRERHHETPPHSSPPPPPPRRAPPPLPPTRMCATSFSRPRAPCPTRDISTVPPDVTRATNWLPHRDVQSIGRAGHLRPPAARRPPRCFFFEVGTHRADKNSTQTRGSRAWGPMPPRRPMRHIHKNVDVQATRGHPHTIIDTKLTGTCLRSRVHLVTYYGEKYVGCLGYAPNGRAVSAES